MIQIIETLTQRVWSYADNVLPTNPFMFTGPQWQMGDYIVKNMSGVNVSVVLFGQTTVVPAHTNYEFMAHRQLESVIPTTGSKTVGKPRSVNAGETAVGADNTAASAAPGTSVAPPPEQIGGSPSGTTPTAAEPGLDTAHGARAPQAARSGPPTPAPRRR